MQKKKIISMIFHFFMLCLLVLGVNAGTTQAVPKMSASYEGYELDGNKLYLKVKVRNRTFNVEKRRTTPQKMVLKLLTGEVAVEGANGTKIIKRKQGWRLNDAVMPEKEFRLYAGEVDNAALKQAGNSLKVKLGGLSTKSVVDKRMVYCAVTEWKWDDAKKAVRLVMDIGNDHYYDVVVNGIEAELGGSDVKGMLQTWQDIELIVPRYEHRQVVLYTQPFGVPPKGEWIAKRVRRHFIMPPKPETEEDDESQGYVYAKVAENESEYDDYNYSADDYVIDGSNNSKNTSDDDFIVVSSKDTDDDVLVVTSQNDDVLVVSSN